MDGCCNGSSIPSAISRCQARLGPRGFYSGLAETAAGLFSVSLGLDLQVQMDKPHDGGPVLDQAHTTV